MSGKLVNGPLSAAQGVEQPSNTDRGNRSGLRYRPIIALGQGGMAEVLLSVGSGPGGFHKLVVLKTMRKELVADADMREMFLAEARLSARLNHANVVQVYEVVDTALPCIVMEYLEGQAMSALQRTAGEAFTLALQLKVISETLSGLHYSHELKDYDGTPLNIVHRDISPQNIFITYDGVVKVLDFGIAKASDATNQTRTGVIKGKITYMPREQLLNENVDRRADIYAVGCMLWHAAAGTKLWADIPEGEVMRALIEGKIPKPSDKRPVAPQLEAIVMKALAPDANLRYSTALELRAAVDEFMAANSPGASLHEVGALMSKMFSDQQEARKKQIHLALTAPYSEPPPVVPEGLESIIRSSTGNSANYLRDEPRRQMVWVVVAAVAAAVLAVLGMVTFFAWRGSRAEQGATPAVAPSAQIQVRLAVTPPGAMLAVDGHLVSGNPAVVTVPGDLRDHEIRATLPGHEPYLRIVRFERDLSLDIMLQPTTASAIGSGSAVPSEPTAAGKSVTSSASRSATRVTSARIVQQPVVPGKKAVRPECAPPFYFDHGIKVYKPGCL